jgi:hypothetical protein
VIVSATRLITDPSGLLYLEREDAAVSAFVNRIRDQMASEKGAKGSTDH